MEGKMTDHIHKRLTDEQVRTILDRYLKKELSGEQGMNLLGLKRGRLRCQVYTLDNRLGF